MKKCVPTETYLAIIVTNPVESDLLKAFKRDEKGYNADVAQYLSIFILIPRPGIGEVMGYCIGNLHKYPHGTLHVDTEQDIYFKEATTQLKSSCLTVEWISMIHNQLSMLATKTLTISTREWHH